MRLTKSLIVTAVLALAVSAAGATAAPGHMKTMSSSKLSAETLRVTLDNLFSEHAALAMNATNAGVTGSKSFPAAAKALDRNSVAISKAIASIYGAKAGNTFLNGKNMWRDHIRDFVAYTVATAKHDRMGQQKAVANLKAYTVSFGNFLAGATGLPKAAVRNDLLGHVFELKSQLDDFAAGNYAKAAADYHAAYEHMYMTADLVAGAIAKQKNLK